MVCVSAEYSLAVFILGVLNPYSSDIFFARRRTIERDIIHQDLSPYGEIAVRFGGLKMRRTNKALLFGCGMDRFERHHVAIGLTRKGVHGGGRP